MERTTNGQTNLTAEYAVALETKADRWVAACGGREVAFLHHGTQWLYVYNHATGQHGYLNLSTDIVHENAPWS